MHGPQRGIRSHAARCRLRGTPDTTAIGDTGVRMALSGAEHSVQPGDELAHVGLAGGVDLDHGTKPE